MSGQPYVLGIDLGTAYTAAAVSRGGRSEVVAFSSAGAVIPSVVVLREDGTVLVGDAAERRAVTEPSRTAREFKRRIGDTTPILVGGTPYGAEALSAHVLRAVLGDVVAREAGRPHRIVLTHPASWGPFKLDLLRQAAVAADLGPVDLVAEPEAAAVHYTGLGRIEVGQIVAVYDLGGGTFDAAVLRRTSAGFQVLGTPEGIERFGGIDVDRAVLAHVDRALDGLLTEQADSSDPAVRIALSRLRDDVRAAKEALSSDTDATIPVMLPSLATEVRITRGELESLIRPRLIETVDAMDRALRSAGVTWDDVANVLTVGGSSRMPIVRDVLRERTGRPVSTDAHPKHAIALGAADIALARSRATVAAPAPVLLPPPAAVPTVAVGASAPTPAPAGRTGAIGFLRTRRGAVVAGAAALVVGAVAVIALTRGGTPGSAVAASATQPSTTPSVVLGLVPATTVPTTIAPTTAPATTTAAPTTAPPTTVAPTTVPPTTLAPTSVATIPSTTLPPTTLPATTAPAPTLVPPGVAPVVDATGSFLVDVPTSFANRTQPLTVGSTTMAQVSASAQIDRYLAGDWSVLGFSVVTGQLTAATTATQVVRFVDPGASCTTSTGQLPYTAAQGSGVIVRFDGCGGIDASEVLIAVEVPALQAFVLVGAQGPGPSDGALLGFAQGVLASVRQP